MFLCSDPACQQVFAEPRCECSRCGARVFEPKRRPWDQTAERAQSYMNCYCGVYQPDAITTSNTAQYNAVRLTWQGTHGREAHLEFYDGGGVHLMLSSRLTSQVLPYMTEHNNSALQIIQSFLHGE